MTDLRLITQEESWKAAVQADVVERLERWLARAKAGELTCIAIAASTVDNATLYGWSDGVPGGKALMVAGIARLQFAFMADDHTD